MKTAFINKLLVFQLLLTGSSGIFAQTPTWENYVASNVVSDFCFDQNFIWVASRGGGLVKIDKTSGITSYYYKTNSGIPSVQLTSIRKDQQGYLWIGSSDRGLIRFDGLNQWLNYNSQNSMLPTNNVLSLNIDDNGGIWIGTAKGLAYLCNNNWSIYFNQLFHHVNDIIIDTSGIVWAAITEQGLGKFVNNSWVLYQTSNTGVMELNNVYDLSFDNTGKLILLCNDNQFGKSYTGDVVSFDGSNWEIINVDSTGCLGKLDLYSIECDEAGNIWFAGFKYDSVCTQIGYFDGQDAWYVPNPFIHSNPYRNNWIGKIFLDSLNHLWFAADGGLACYDKSTSSWTDYSSKLIHSIGGAQIYALEYNKASKEVWAAVHSSAPFGLGSWGADKGFGMSVYNGNNWFNFSDTSALIQSNTIAAFTFDHSNNTWFCSQDLFAPPSITNPAHVTVYNGIQFLDYSPNDTSLNGSNGFICMATDTNGRTWAGTMTGKLYMYDNAGWLLMYDFDSLNPGYFYIKKIYFDKSGTMWLGCHQHLIEVSNGAVTVYASPFSPFSPAWNRVNDILGDHLDNLWVLTRNELIKIENHQWTVYTMNNSGLTTDEFTALALDSTHKLWVGTADSGLICWDYTGIPPAWTSYNYNNSGLSENYITDIVVDSLNNIWIGTEYAGICVLKNNTIVSDEPFKINPCADEIQLNIYPNPFSGCTNIQFALTTAMHVNLSIFNHAGQKILDLTDDFFPAGKYEYTLHSKCKAGTTLHGGLYFCVLHTDKVTLTKKLIHIP